MDRRDEMLKLILQDYFTAINVSTVSKDAMLVMLSLVGIIGLWFYGSHTIQSMMIACKFGELWFSLSIGAVLLSQYVCIHNTEREAIIVLSAWLGGSAYVPTPPSLIERVINFLSLIFFTAGIAAVSYLFIITIS